MNKKTCDLLRTNAFQLGLSLTLLSMATTSSADVGGTVFRDLAVNGSVLNTYGVKDANELGIEGITVTAYDDLGSIVGTSVSTATDGSWVIAGTSGDVRIEFTGIPSYLASSPVNTGSNTTVQFITDGTAEASSVDLGLHEAADYSNTAAPEVILSSWIGGTSIAGGNNPTHYSFPYDRNGQNEDDTFVDDGNGNNIAVKTTAPTTDAKASETGSTWGLAYQKNQQRYFSSTALRRHAGLKAGTGTIFVVDKAVSPASVIHEFDLNGINTTSGGVINLGSVCRGGGCESDLGNTGIANDYDISINANGRSIDLDGMKKVGKIAFGDIDMEPQTNNLWAVNLNQKALIKVDVGDSDATNLPVNVDQYLISGLAGIPSCNNGEIRPWGLNFSQGKGYLGIACDAASGGDEGDLVGFVLSFDPNDVAAGFVEEVQFPLGFARTTDARYTFAPWSHDWNDFRNMFGTRFTLPQAIVSDIEFDKRGNMNIALIDRAGMQLGSSNYKPISGNSELVGNQSRGDIYHACKTAVGFEMEASGACPVHQFTTVVHHSGSNQNNFTQGFQQNGEFFEDRTGDSDSEGAMGALALLKGSEKMIMTHLDPHPSGSVGRSFWTSQGVNWVNPTSGAIEQYYTLYASNDVAEFGKAAGIGDVEILTALAPIEIGNRVWVDTNGNGIQDAGEAGIAGVTVELLDGAGTSVIATATTDANGNYIFSSDPSGTDSSSHKYNLTSLNPNTAYTVRIPDISGGSKQTNLLNYALTTPNTTTGTGSDINDSDGVASSDNADAPVLAADIPHSGANNHMFDFGFVPPVSIGSYVWEDANADGLQTSGESAVTSGTVTLVDENGVQVTTDLSGNTINPINLSTNADGLFFFDNLAPGKYKIRVTPPAGFIPTPTQVGADDNDTENDSNINTAAVGIPAGTYESGVFTLTSGGEPSEGSEVGDDQDNAAIAAEDSGNMTVDFGLIQLASIGDTVWYDTDRDGVQDSGETGVSGVTVTLFKDGVSTGQTDITDGSGLYGFTDLEPGDYNVVFDLTTLPTAYVVSPQDQGSDNAADSDANTTTGFTVQTTLTSGENDPSWDMGINQPVASIGDTVWYDTDRDGVQDSGETGVSGITVTLFKDGVSTGQTDITDGSGLYGFTDLEPGNYNVVFDLTTLPTAYVVSPQDQGSDNAADSDANTSSGATVETTLDPGENDPSWDMGINLPVVPTVKIGDLVWIEDDNDGNPATGTITFPPVGTVVTATASDGTTTYTDTTDVNGNYLIDVPANDTYTVTVATPTGTIPTLGSTDNSVPDTTSENNNSHDGSGTTVIVTTEDNLTLDFGFVPTVQIGSLIWYEDDNDGDATTGSVTYPPAGVVVTATAPDGSSYTGITGTNGSYSIDVPINGTYIVTIPPPSGYSPTAGSNDNGVPSDNSEDNKSHSGSGTSVTVGTTDNLTVDFGFINNSLLQPPSNEPIPTLSEWALLMLMMMLGFVGYRQGLTRKR